MRAGISQIVPDSIDWADAGDWGLLTPDVDALRALGVSMDRVTHLVRLAQWMTLSSFCYLLDDPAWALDFIPPEEHHRYKGIGWRLHEFDMEAEQSGDPVGDIQDLVGHIEPIAGL